MEPTVICQQPDARIAILTLNRPHKRNALTIELMESLESQMRRLESQPECRSVILHGAGPAFCAGLDLVEAADTTVAEHSAQWVAKTFESLSTSPLITIAAVHGGAFAGGVGLMSSCDLVVAADDLKVAFPEVRRGLVPALVTSVLRNRLRDSEMRELFLLAESIDATRALSLGLVQRVVRSDQLRSEALAVAQTVCKGGPEAVRETKQLIRELGSISGRESIKGMLAIHTKARTSDEAQEGLAAFRERREPDW